MSNDSREKTPKNPSARPSRYDRPSDDLGVRYCEHRHCRFVLHIDSERSTERIPDIRAHENPIHWALAYNTQISLINISARVAPYDGVKRGCKQRNVTKTNLGGPNGITEQGATGKYKPASDHHRTPNTRKRTRTVCDTAARNATPTPDRNQLTPPPCKAMTNTPRRAIYRA